MKVLYLQIGEYAKSVFLRKMGVVLEVFLPTAGSVSPLCWKLLSKTWWKCHLLEVDKWANQRLAGVGADRLCASYLFKINSKIFLQFTHGTGKPI
jgi:hypothetical protein